MSDGKKRERWTMIDLMAKAEWEGREYIIDELSSNEMPTDELSRLHRAAKDASDAFWEAYEELSEDAEPATDEEED